MRKERSREIGREREGEISKEEGRYNVHVGRQRGREREVAREGVRSIPTHLEVGTIISCDMR